MEGTQVLERLQWLNWCCAWQDAENGEQPVQLASSREEPLVALAFKLEEGRFGQLTYMRIYSGTLRKGDNVVNVVTGKRIKVLPSTTLSDCLAVRALCLLSSGAQKSQPPAGVCILDGKWYALRWLDYGWTDVLICGSWCCL